ncbi:MAG TPA: DNA-directed RNA polymerase subunit beta, partial [Alphaproteobacteria bacterium]|nr:DNA-directed RNA polymerase subunit beta [Alphaproteobacteria bacterium]
ADSGEVVLEAGTKFTPRLGRKLAERGVKELLVSAEELDGRFVACDMINEKTGEIYVEAGEELTPELIERLEQEGITELVLLDVDGVNIGAYMRNTMIADKNETRDEALVDIYRVMRPGEPPTLETAEGLFSGLFFDPERYDLSSVGRVKMNMRLELECEDTVRTLRKEDILAVVKTLVDLRDGRGEID